MYKPCIIEADAELASVPAISSATHKAQIEVPLCNPGKYFFFKGQLISEWLLDALNFPKNQRKNMMNLSPRI